MIFFPIILSALCDAVVPQQAIVGTMISPERFDKDVIPMGIGETLDVNITLNSFRLLSMDQKEETIQFQQEFLMTWHDHSLGWSRRNFSAYRFEWVKVRQKDIWVPDIIYYSTIDNERIIETKEAYADVKYDGTTRLSVPSTVTLPCTLQLDNFPYDDQTCDLLLGSWIFDENQLKTTPTEMTIEPAPSNVPQRSSIIYVGNSEWSLTEIEVSNYTLTIKKDGNYSLIRYRVKLRRKPVYYVMVIQVPTLLIGTVTILGMFTPFSQRMERWQKVELGLNMLLAISMMLNLVSNMMPKAERLPLLGNYIIAEIFLCSAATVVSIGLLEVHARADQRKWRPPDCLCRWVLFSCGRRIRKGQKRAMMDPIATIPPKMVSLDDDVAADLLKA
ncbi:unnamed protein product, partial [Mesorhabditis belari]|uniref:Neurotransmitter-gated ion-channel ligand-binding domain-containing protein n=1 Tax=Mesorhabditis belari TaxID=2138241 RepID=A0AAF3J1R3_9BILA